MLLNHISNLDIKEIDLSKINKTPNMASKPVTEFNEMESFMRNSLQLYTPAFNDIEDPSKNLKDV
jgi:hypothetical protein